MIKIAEIVATIVVVGQNNRDFGQLLTKALPVVLHQALHLLNSIFISPAFRIAL